MSQDSLNEQRAQRLRNLESLRERGFEAYPYTYEASHEAQALQNEYAENEPGTEWPLEVSRGGSRHAATRDG